MIPIINENDTVTTDEIRFGDNDTLGALVTNLIEADVLVLLTDQQGLFTADPRMDPAATLVRDARAGDPELERMAGGAGSAIGRGGMLTKVLAAKRAARSGASTIIACGREPDVLTRLAAGEAIGTTLTSERTSLAARKQWLADHVRLAGRLTLDSGAVRALTQDGKSLLPIGVVAVAGSFGRGEIVGCFAPDGREIARGLVNYGAQEAARIVRRPSSEIEAVLGYVDEPELIHRRTTWLMLLRLIPTPGARECAAASLGNARFDSRRALPYTSAHQRAGARGSPHAQRHIRGTTDESGRSHQGNSRRAAQRMGEDRRRARHRAIALHGLDHDSRGDRPDRVAACDAVDPARHRAVRAVADHHVRAGADRRCAGAVVRRHEGFHRVAQAHRV